MKDLYVVREAGGESACFLVPRARVADCAAFAVSDDAVQAALEQAAAASVDVGRQTNRTHPDTVFAQAQRMTLGADTILQNEGLR